MCTYMYNDLHGDVQPFDPLGQMSSAASVGWVQSVGPITPDIVDTAGAQSCHAQLGNWAAGEQCQY